MNDHNAEQNLYDFMGFLRKNEKVLIASRIGQVESAERSSGQ